MIQLHRYIRTQHLFNNYTSSKFLKFNLYNSSKLNNINVQAGLYKVNSLLPEHGLILSTLTNQPSQISYQLHGKRQRRTVSVNTKISNKLIWVFLDKLLHELFTHMLEFETPKTRKWKKFTKIYNLRIRQKFTLIPEHQDLIESSMHDSHKGIYLPLTINFQLSKFHTNYENEIYFRMLRLPISLFKRKAKPAFDDKISFEGVHYLYAE